MNFLISLNKRMFSKVNAEQLIDTIKNLDKNNVVKGAEIYVDMMSDEEKEYCLNLVKLMKENNLIVQVHSADMHDLEKVNIEQYLLYYNKIALLCGNKIKLTMHPATDNSKYECIQKTIETIKFINKYIDYNKLDLEVLIENLNEHRGMLRCNIYQVYEMIDSLKVNGITFDMGHFVYDYSNDYTNLDNEYSSKIQNVHIHDIDGNRNDHYPFYYNNVKIQEIVKYINAINYKENIVLEYGLDYLKGETFEDKIAEYIKQIEYVSNIFNIV